MEAAAIAIAAAGVLATALLGGLARSIFKMYSAKRAECEKLKDENKYLQTKPGTKNRAFAYIKTNAKFY